MIETLSKYQMVNALTQDENASWSYSGACELIDYLLDLEDSIGQQIEFDPVGLRSDYSEYDSLIEWAEDNFANYREEFGIEYENPMTAETEEQSVTDCDGNLHDEVIDSIAKYIRDNSTLIEFEGGIIVRNF
jgi:hypothetical protein|tara:strand:- start:14 stop:409 length:396 start_codon:yes stop_codon:yes gene_type:complete